jgi:hypothetical protein
MVHLRDMAAIMLGVLYAQFMAPRANMPTKCKRLFNPGITFSNGTKSVIRELLARIASIPCPLLSYLLKTSFSAWLVQSDAIT